MKILDWLSRLFGHRAGSDVPEGLSSADLLELLSRPQPASGPVDAADIHGPGPYVGSQAPPPEPPQDLYLRLVRVGGMNPMEAALRCRGRSFLCPLSPRDMYAEGMRWTLRADCPINNQGGLYGGSWYRLGGNSTMEIETLNEVPTEKGRHDWVVYALRLIYPRYAIPEEWQVKDAPKEIEE